LKTTGEKTTPILTFPARGRPLAPGYATDTAIPVYVIGGILGSGKTTLLRRLIRHVVQGGGRPAVLMNELSETNVDGALLHDHEADSAFEIRTILNGCVCCDRSEELTEELQELLQSSAGPVFVETTGLASVGQAAHVVSRALGQGVRRGRLASVIAVVDARRFAMECRHSGQPSAEIAGADTVILNKVDGLSGQAVSLAEARIRALNPGARVFRATFADVAPLDVLSPSGAKLGSTAHDRDADALTRSADGYESVSAKLLGPVRVDRLTRLFQEHQHKLVRVKGFVRLADAWGFQALQWAPGAAEVELEPRRKPRGIRSQLVIIGRDMDWDAFATELDDCVDMDSQVRRTA
jgi:G3E family GTPase